MIRSVRDLLRWDFPYYQHIWRKTYGCSIHSATWVEVVEWFLWLIGESEVAGSDPERDAQGFKDRDARRKAWANLLLDTGNRDVPISGITEVTTSDNQVVSVRMRDSSSLNPAIMKQVRAAMEGAKI